MPNAARITLGGQSRDLPAHTRAADASRHGQSVVWPPLSPTAAIERWGWKKSRDIGSRAPGPHSTERVLCLASMVHGGICRMVWALSILELTYSSAVELTPTAITAPASRRTPQRVPPRVTPSRVIPSRATPRPIYAPTAAPVARKYTRASSSSAIDMDRRYIMWARLALVLLLAVVLVACLVHFRVGACCLRVWRRGVLRSWSHPDIRSLYVNSSLGDSGPFDGGPNRRSYKSFDARSGRGRRRWHGDANYRAGSELEKIEGVSENFELGQDGFFYRTPQLVPSPDPDSEGGGGGPAGGPLNSSSLSLSELDTTDVQF